MEERALSVKGTVAGEGIIALIELVGVVVLRLVNGTCGVRTTRDSSLAKRGFQRQHLALGLDWTQVCCTLAGLGTIAEYFVGRLIGFFVAQIIVEHTVVTSTGDFVAFVAHISADLAHPGGAFELRATWPRVGAKRLHQRRSGIGSWRWRITDDTVFGLGGAATCCVAAVVAKLLLAQVTVLVGGRGLKIAMVVRTVGAAIIRWAIRTASDTVSIASWQFVPVATEMPELAGTRCGRPHPSGQILEIHAWLADNAVTVGDRSVEGIVVATTIVVQLRSAGPVNTAGKSKVAVGVEGSSHHHNRPAVLAHAGIDTGIGAIAVDELSAAGWHSAGRLSGITIDDRATVGVAVMVAIKKRLVINQPVAIVVLAIALANFASAWITGQLDPTGCRWIALRPRLSRTAAESARLPGSVDALLYPRATIGPCAGAVQHQASVVGVEFAKEDRSRGVGWAAGTSLVDGTITIVIAIVVG